MKKRRGQIYPIHECGRRLAGIKRWDGGYPIQSKFNSRCASCGGPIAKGDALIFYPKAKTNTKVWHLDCAEKRSKPAVIPLPVPVKPFDEDPELAGYLKLTIPVPIPRPIHPWLSDDEPTSGD